MDRPEAIGIQWCAGQPRAVQVCRIDGGHYRVRCDVPLGATSAPDAMNASNATLQRSSAVVAALSGNEVIGRFWTLPKVPASQLKAVLMHRLEADVPLPMAEWVWQYRCVARGDQTAVSIQAARAMHVQRAMDGLASLGVRPDRLSTQAEGLAAFARLALKNISGEANEAIVVLQDEQCWVVVLSQGMARSCQCVRTKSQSASQRMHACCERLLVEHQAEPLAAVHVIAAEPQSVDVQAWSAVLGVTVAPAALSVQLTDDAGGAIAWGRCVSMLSAMGLAMAACANDPAVIALAESKVPTPTLWDRRFSRITHRPVYWSMIAAVGVVVAGWLSVTTMKAENARMSEVLARVDRSDSPAALQQEKTRMLHQLSKYRIDVEAILGDIVTAVPDPIVITSIQMGREQKLTIKGTAGDPKTVFAMVEALRKSTRVCRINPERIEPTPGGAFVISAELTDVAKVSSMATRGDAWK